MFNSQRPRDEDLPTNRQLLGATGIAAVIAAALLVAVILPAEYAIDPTGIGRALGMTEMGETKVQLAQEAALDAAAETAVADRAASGAVVAATDTGSPAPSADTRSDTTTLTLAPGEGAEIKVTANKGAQIQFAWSVEGGHVNFDTHGDPPNAPRDFYHGYGKGRESTGEEGRLVAAFDGKHGWFWRNRSDAPVTVTLRTSGQYSEVRRLV
ncbi:MAG: transmembrane anchor protein [Sphingomonadales bacterium 32-68-7]|nr:MAG: transmembrane anchor protein [Sphingomonadales bacterium 12-68-11]OYX10086.1 MAG: transmembrane anchor protein [Sphingomonadales bacterium 32-68-7]